MNISADLEFLLLCLSVFCFPSYAKTTTTYTTYTTITTTTTYKERGSSYTFCPLLPDLLHYLGAYLVLESMPTVTYHSFSIKTQTHTHSHTFTHSHKCTHRGDLGGDLQCVLDAGELLSL